MKIIIFFFILFAIMFFLAVRIMKANEIEIENKMTEAYMEYMNELYGVIQERIEATRRYRHDLAKHIQTLEYLYQKNEDGSEQMKSYMDRLKGRYKEITEESFCGDEIVNSILAVKKQQCKERGIPIHIYVDKKYYGHIREIEMVGLLHNLLDNAMEANERIPEDAKKGISFFMEKEGNQIKIKLKNFINPDEKIDFQTKKKEKDLHGIGIGIIDSMIKDHHGTRTVKIDEEKHILKQYITLYEDER